MPFKFPAMDVPQASSSVAHGLRSSSPIPIPDEAISVRDFCAAVNLGDDFAEKLEALQFTVGDDLSIVPEAEWKAAGFASLSWGRVTKAHKRYMKSARK